MAKTIIIIEDTDVKTKSFDIKVLKFQTPDEQAASETSAILIGEELAAVLTGVVIKRAKCAEKTTVLSPQSTSRH